MDEYSAGIFAEIGDINRFDSHAAVAKYAGLVWSQRQSGLFEAQNTHLIHFGNRYLRYCLCEAANSLVLCDTEFRRYATPSARRQKQIRTHIRCSAAKEAFKVHKSSQQQIYFCHWLKILYIISLSY